MTPFENASKEAFERRHLKHAGLAAEAEREHGWQAQGGEEAVQLPCVFPPPSVPSHVVCVESWRCLLSWPQHSFCGNTMGVSIAHKYLCTCLCLSFSDLHTPSSLSLRGFSLSVCLSAGKHRGLYWLYCLILPSSRMTTGTNSPSTPPQTPFPPYPHPPQTPHPTPPPGPDLAPAVGPLSLAA